jgi:hypothetical protein
MSKGVLVNPKMAPSSLLARSSHPKQAMIAVDEPGPPRALQTSRPDDDEAKSCKGTQLGAEPVPPTSFQWREAENDGAATEPAPPISFQPLNQVELMGRLGHSTMMGTTRRERSVSEC